VTIRPDDLKRAPSAAPTAGQASELSAAITDLQTRLTYQEDEIQHLNRVLEQQRVALEKHALQIEQLRRLVAALSEALREQITDSPPPHY
jgi:SlyX protein